MSESAEVPEKRRPSDSEAARNEFPSDLPSQTSPNDSGADETDEETQDILLELPEDELLDLPQAEGVTVTQRTDAGEADEAFPNPPPQRIEEDVLDRPGDDLAGDTDILKRGVGEGDESGAPVEEPLSTSSDQGPAPSAVVSPDTAYESEEDRETGTPSSDAESPESPILVRAPEGADVFALSELILEPSGRPLGATAARWIGRLLQKLEEAKLGTGETDEPQIAAWIRETVAPTIQTGETSTESQEPFVFAASEAAEETSVRNRLKGNGKKKSLLRELAGIVLGGLGGLLIAYYALNWFGGPQYDFANIPLPGVKHTYRHAPPWLKPYLQPSKHSQQREAGDASPQDL